MMSSKYILYIFTALLMFVSCSDKLEPTDDCLQKKNQKKVLIIGVDGVRADCLKKAHTPAIDALKINGFFTESNRIDSVHSLSSANWGSILSGVWSDKHLAINNNFTKHDFENYPSFLKRINDTFPELKVSSYVNWNQINKFIIDGVDRNITDEDDIIKDRIITDIEDCTSEVIFIHFGNVDKTGHKYGFDPSINEYLKSIEKIDTYISDIISTLNKRRINTEEEWLIIFVTDHGGIKVDKNGKTTGKHIGYGDNPHVKHVPLLIKNTSNNIDISTKSIFVTDIAPTVLEYLNIEIKSKWDLDGQSLIKK